MTSLAYIHDCHSCYDERSNDPKKNACAMMEMNMEAFFDDYRILQLRVTIPVTFF